MNLSIKTQIIILLVAVGVGFTAGILIKPKQAETTVKQETKTSEAVHEHMTEKITKSPDGTTVTTIDTTKQSDIRVDDTTKSEVVPAKRVNVSALLGTSLHDPLIPIYGVLLSKPVFSNLTVGGYAMSNGTIGVSVGWDF